MGSKSLTGKSLLLSLIPEDIRRSVNHALAVVHRQQSEALLENIDETMNHLLAQYALIARLETDYIKKGVGYDSPALMGRVRAAFVDYMTSVDRGVWHATRGENLSMMNVIQSSLGAASRNMENLLRDFSGHDNGLSIRVTVSGQLRQASLSLDRASEFIDTQDFLANRRQRLESASLASPSM